MKKLAIVLTAFLILAQVLAVGGCGGGEGTTTPTEGTTTPTEGLPNITLKLAHDHPEDDILGSITEEFADRVSEATGGKLTIEIFPLGTLFSGFTLWTGVASGQIDMASCYDYVPAVADPGLYICGTPGLFSSWEQGYEFAMHPDGGQKILEMMEQYGVKGLGIFPGSFQLVTMSKNREIESWHDMKGLRQMGYGGDVSETYTEITGMHPVYVASSEVYSALAQGMIDVAQSSPDVAIRTHREEVCNYAYVWAGLGVQNVEILMDLKVWNSLPAVYQEAIEQVIDEMATWALQLAMDAEEAALAELEDSITLHWESDEDRIEMMQLWQQKLEQRGYYDQFDPDVLAVARQIGGTE